MTEEEAVMWPLLFVVFCMLELHSSCCMANSDTPNRFGGQ